MSDDTTPTPPENLQSSKDAWEWISWLNTLTEEQRQPWFEPLVELLRAYPRHERETLMNAMKQRLHFSLGTIQEHLKLLQKNKGAAFKLQATVVDRTFLAEMVYRPDEEPRWGFMVQMFATPDEPPQFFDKIKQGETEIHPLASDLITSGAVILPSSFEEYGDDASLFASLGAFIGKYVQVDTPSVLDLAAGFVMYSWASDRFPVAAYLRFEGDFAAGKTTMLRTLAHVCYRSTLAGGAATAAPIFRVLDLMKGGTLICDEADFDTKDTEWKQILKILNQGWSKGSPVLRAERPSEHEPFGVRSYDPFGPKVLASRRAFPDVALESRCLAHTMVPVALRPDIPLFPDKLFYHEAISLRNQLLLWRFRNYNNIQADPRKRIAGVEPRVAANGLIVLSAVADPRVRETLEVRLREMSEGLRQSRHDSFEGVVAQAVLQAWVEAVNRNQPLRLSEAAAILRTRHQQRIGDRKFGELVRKTLGLQTKPVGGTYRIVSSDADLRALAVRYGVELGGFGPPPPEEPRPVRTPVRAPEP
jgi:hypothetical protein